MASRLVRAAAAVLLLLAVQGCATRAIPMLPSRLEGGEGLLVARFLVLDTLDLENAEIDVDGHSNRTVINDGYLAVPLPAGPHLLRQLRTAGTVTGNVRHFQTLEVGRSFEIVPDRVTNLGLMVYRRIPDPPRGRQPWELLAAPLARYRRVTLDNGAETRAFLEINYPAFASTLQSSAPDLAPTALLEPERLADLRKDVAVFDGGRRRVEAGLRTITFGKVGTLIVETRRTPGDPVPAVEVVDTGTLADVVGAVVHGDRLAFLTSDAQLRTVEHGRRGAIPLPGRLHAVGMYPFGPQGFLVMETHARILTTAEAGGPWTVYEGLAIGTPRRDMVAASAPDVTYLCFEPGDLPAGIYRYSPGDAAPTPIGEPPAGGFTPPGRSLWMAAGQGGLIVQGPPPLFFLYDAATGAWARRASPDVTCGPVAMAEQGARLSAVCSSVVHTSDDGGVSWSSPSP